MFHKSLIYFILFMALFGGGIISLGAPSLLSHFSDLVVLLFLVLSFISRAGKGMPIPHLWQIIAFFIFFTLLSILINEYPADRAIFSLRLIFRFYIFYLAIIIMDPSDDLLKKINLFLLILLVLQFPIIAIKFLNYGISERTSGAYSVHDGSIATTLPISFIFYMASFYLIFRNRISFILIGFGYVICSILGGKRAIFFLYPIQFFCIYYFIYAKETHARFSKKFAALVMCFLIIITVSVSILYLNKSLNPDNEVGGKIDIGYAFEYANRYNLGVDGYGNSFGRIATTKRVLEILYESGFSQVLFGIGPGATILSPLDSRKERRNFNKSFDEYKIIYGWTTINRIALEYGLLGAMVFSFLPLSFTYLCIKLYRKEIDSYWKAFAAGSVGFSFSMLFFAFAYHWSTFFGNTMPVLYFYAMAVVYIRYYKRSFVNEQHIVSKVLN